MKRIITSIVSVAAAAVLAFALVGCGSDESTETESDAQTQVTKAVVTVEGYPSFTINLDAEAAPQSVDLFVKLAQEGYYDGSTFHRIIPGFCFQGGIPADGNENTETIQGEFSENGVENALADNFEEGVVAMARTSVPDSASGQWFVTLGSDSNVSQSLNGKYAAFGTISEAGMKTVQQIVSDVSGSIVDSNGTVLEGAQPVIKSIVIK